MLQRTKKVAGKLLLSAIYKEAANHSAKGKEPWNTVRRLTKKKAEQK
jgi:hypothetical protein